MTKKYYKDFYGNTASIRLNADGSADLTVYAGGGFFKQHYKTLKGAKIALSKWSDSWRQTD